MTITADTTVNIDSNVSTTNVQIETKKPKRKCPVSGCGKKLQLTDMECRCGVIHCMMHRLPETHACNYDHAAADWSRLVTRLMDEQVTHAKVVGI
jgi:predicted nucleic acid binding AN1-type Zn finger protein